MESHGGGPTCHKHSNSIVFGRLGGGSFQESKEEVLDGKR